MRIGIFVQPVAVSQKTGISRYTVGLVEALLELGTDDLFYLYYRRQKNDPVKDWLAGHPRVVHRGFAFPDIDERPKWWWDYYLPARLVLDRISVFHSPSHIVPSFGPPSVVTIHDLAYYFMKVKGEGLDRYLKRWTDRSMKLATKVTAVSQSTANDCIGQGVDREKVHVIYQGFESAVSDPASVLSEDSAFPDSQSLLQKGYVLFMGTMQPRKNVPYLVEEYARVASQVSWDLVLAGAPGESSDDVARSIDRFGVGDRVHQLGFVDDQQRASLYRNAAVFAYPSRYEGFGLVVLEAMSYGVPVVASSNSSLPEAVGGAGTLVDVDREGSLAEAILELHDRAELRHSHVEKGYKHVQRFSWEASAAQMLELYYQAASARR
ncbi:glycosyltransferase family 4 protein [Stieleria sp. JC731]|uniref:glycosyltransferase family 4 protein n=1 Tax=Pirellulaceae TaxID=2691357 RepID=UPI001E610E05|nr:glycosyltransferase family 1 protein [Stieleria sp. JC731]MCC9601453.1 glycosyltransferase family 4 protein [Stieleria sp. JC731]